MPSATKTPEGCVQLVRLDTGGAVCASHFVSTAPWHRPAGCGLPVASLCSLCSRTIVPIRGRFSWSFACPTCRRIDSALAAVHGASAMTPLEGQSGANRGTLYERLHPELADRTALQSMEVRNGRPEFTIVDDVPAWTAGAALLRQFRSAAVLAMSATHRLESVWVEPSARVVVSTIGHPMEQCSAGWFVPLQRWNERFPASVAASARSYQGFVRAAHPWIDSVEPRVNDLDWLIACAESTPVEG